MGWISVSGTVFNPNVGPMQGLAFAVRVSNARWPCASCPFENGMPVNPADCNNGYVCDMTQEGWREICVPGTTNVNVVVHHGLAGTLTILGAGSGLEVLNSDMSPFTSVSITGSGVHSVPLVLQAEESFTTEVQLTAVFLQDGADLDSQDVFDVIAGPQVTAIALKAGVAETKSIGSLLVKEDFDITTSPPGHEDLVTLDPVTVVPGDNWVVARLCNSEASTNVTAARITGASWAEYNEHGEHDFIHFWALCEGADGTYQWEPFGGATLSGDSSGVLPRNVTIYGTCNITLPGGSGSGAGGLGLMQAPIGGFADLQDHMVDRASLLAWPDPGAGQSGAAGAATTGGAQIVDVAEEALGLLTWNSYSPSRYPLTDPLLFLEAIAAQSSHWTPNTLEAPTTFTASGVGTYYQLVVWESWWAAYAPVWEATVDKANAKQVFYDQDWPYDVYRKACARGAGEFPKVTDTATASDRKLVATNGGTGKRQIGLVLVDGTMRVNDGNQEEPSGHTHWTNGEVDENGVPDPPDGQDFEVGWFTFNWRG